MSNNKQQTKLQPEKRTFKCWDTIGRTNSPNLDLLDGTPDFYGRTRNSVKEMARTYNKMSSSPEGNNDLHVGRSSNKNFENIIGYDVEINRSQKDRFSRLEGTKNDKPAFQITSAKRRDSMNQIEPNIVKRRINEYNCLQSLASFPHPSPLGRRFLEDLERIVEGEDIAFDLQTSSDDEEWPGSQLLEGRRKFDDMYDKHVKNGKKKVSKKTQLQNDHRQLVKFYRKLFTKMTQVPFAIAVVYCSLFFIIQAISLVHTFIYPS